MRNLFYIAIVPPPAAAAAIDNLRHAIWQRYNSQHGLNSPPHITLIPPFKLSHASADELQAKLQELVRNFQPFTLTGKGVNHFDQKTIYAKVDLNEYLTALQKELELLVKEELNFKIERPDRKYTPHLTLAFKDLKKENFKEAFRYLEAQQISLQFPVNNIALLQHSGKRWLIRDRIAF